MAEHPESDPERLDLSAFEVPPVAPGLDERVLARLSPAPRRLRPRMLAAAAAVLCVLLWGAARWVMDGAGQPLSGERAFSKRETVRLGASALAVAEPGTQLNWSAGRRGPVRVRQPAGRVFYRVDTGTDFQVDTPAGQVSVHGTCFTLEVHPMLPSRQSLTSAAVGAALTATVFLTVHEGQVLATSSAGAREAGPGERVELKVGATPRLLPAPALLTDAPAAPGSPPSDEATAAEAPPSWRTRESAYVAELTTLRARVRELESLESERRNSAVSRRANWLEPSQEELLKMARSCKLRWDQPALQLEPVSKPAPKMMQSVGMTEDEAEVVVEVTNTFFAESLAKLRAIYVAATGDENGAHALSPSALEQEILDKSRREDAMRAYQRISQERAGLARPPAQLIDLPPAERLIRFNATLGDAYERALSDKLGAARARELRLKTNLWGTHYDQVGGCPDSK
ncbi:hypothetical protein [Cystobacter fuscus]|uniref:hypothetical protein n=1 Tax=Cystobacter fuscus TaxID=43 RepID=UPI002B2FF8A4|nr:hypothetical protein F0U63_14780 [Cystobacter fuscus]